MRLVPAEKGLKGPWAGPEDTLEKEPRRPGKGTLPPRRSGCEPGDRFRILGQQRTAWLSGPAQLFLLPTESSLKRQKTKKQSVPDSLLTRVIQTQTPRGITNHVSKTGREASSVALGFCARVGQVSGGSGRGVGPCSCLMLWGHRSFLLPSRVRMKVVTSGQELYRLLFVGVLMLSLCSSRLSTLIIKARYAVSKRAMRITEERKLEII